jgi:hypothetical protein
MTENQNSREDLTSCEASELKELLKNPKYILSSSMTNFFAARDYIGFNGQVPFQVPFVTELGKIAMAIAIA